MHPLLRARVEELEVDRGAVVVVRPARRRDPFPGGGLAAVLGERVGRIDEQRRLEPRAVDMFRKHGGDKRDDPGTQSFDAVALARDVVGDASG